MRTTLVSLVTAAALSSAGSSAHAACTMPTGTIELYAGASSGHDNSDICNYDASTGKYSACRLRGWLYRPSSAGKHPAIVFIQGSGVTKNQSGQCSMISYYVAQGFAVWVPYLRGYNDATTANITDESGNVVVTNPNAGLSLVGFNNTGTYVGAGSPTMATTVSRMQSEDDHEISWAIDYLTSTYASSIDATKIALAGHSYGGITVTLAAERAVASKIAAIVDMSGGDLSWHTSSGGVDVALSVPMCTAASNRTLPMLMFQTTNESPVYNTPGSDLVDAVASTQTVFNCATSGSYQTQAEMQVYSPVPGLDVNGPWCGGSTDPLYHCAHTTFTMDPLQVNRWITQVVDFLAHNGIAP